MNLEPQNINSLADTIDKIESFYFPATDKHEKKLAKLLYAHAVSKSFLYLSTLLLTIFSHHTYLNHPLNIVSVFITVFVGIVFGYSPRW